MCHGVSAGGFNGNVNSFAGITAIPGSGPNAMQGYSVLETGSAVVGPMLAMAAAGPLGDAVDAAFLTAITSGAVDSATVATAAGLGYAEQAMANGGRLAYVYNAETGELSFASAHETAAQVISMPANSGNLVYGEYFTQGLLRGTWQNYIGSSEAQEAAVRAVITALEH